MTDLGTRAEEAIASGQPFVALADDEIRRFPYIREFVWEPDARRRAAFIDPAPAMDDPIERRSAAIVRLAGGQTMLDLRPLIQADAERIARLAVDRWAYGRHHHRQRALESAGRISEAARFAAAYILATLPTVDIDALGIAWSTGDLAAQMLVASDRLMESGDEVGKVIALALGPWSAGEWRGVDRFIEHLNAQPRLYNVEASAGSVCARGVIVRGADVHLPVVGWTGSGPIGAWLRDTYETAMHVRVHDPASWNALASAGQLTSVRIAGRDVCHVYLNCSLDSMRIQANIHGGHAFMLSLNLTHEGPSAVGDPWAVAGDVIAVEVWR